MAKAASSDAKNISTTAVLEGNEWVINGEKYYISGVDEAEALVVVAAVLNR